MVAPAGEAFTASVKFEFGVQVKGQATMPVAPSLQKEAVTSGVFYHYDTTLKAQDNTSAGLGTSIYLS